MDKCARRLTHVCNMYMHTRTASSHNQHTLSAANNLWALLGHRQRKINRAVLLGSERARHVSHTRNPHASITQVLCRFRRPVQGGAL